MEEVWVGPLVERCGGVRGIYGICFLGYSGCIFGISCFMSCISVPGRFTGEEKGLRGLFGWWGRGGMGEGV